MEEVKSDFFDDLTSLSEAFSIHVKKGREHRSILVLAEDKVGEDEKVSITRIGSGKQIACLILHYLQSDDNEAIRDAIFSVLRARYKRPVRKFAKFMFFFSLAWMCVLVFIWFYPGISICLMNFITNVLVTGCGVCANFILWKRP